MLTLDKLENRLGFEDDWLTDELDEAIDDLLLFETPSLDLANGFDVITPTEYIAWVQRSLNRVYGSGLVTDGRKTASYRKLVRKFQADHGLPTTGEVDKSTQNKIIKSNESNRSYMAWVHKALECNSVFTDPPRKTPRSSGSYKSYGLQLGIKAFQEQQGLIKDGWVGSKTEIKLIKCCKCLPPGQKKEPDKPNIDYDAALINKLKRAENEIEDWMPLKGNTATLCLIKKLLNPKVDDKFIDYNGVNNYFSSNLKKNPYFGDNFLEAKVVLKNKLRRRWERGASVSVDDFIAFVDKIRLDILQGISRAYFLLTGTEIYDRFRKAEIKRMFQFLVTSNKSIYSCKFALDHYKKSIKKLW